MATPVDDLDGKVCALVTVAHHGPAPLPTQAADLIVGPRLVSRAQLLMAQNTHAKNLGAEIHCSLPIRDTDGGMQGAQA